MLKRLTAALLLFAMMVSLGACKDQTASVTEAGKQALKAFSSFSKASFRNLKTLGFSDERIDYFAQVNEKQVLLRSLTARTSAEVIEGKEIKEDDKTIVELELMITAIDVDKLVAELEAAYKKAAAAGDTSAYSDFNTMVAKALKDENAPLMDSKITLRFSQVENERTGEMEWIAEFQSGIERMMFGGITLDELLDKM